MDAASLTSKLDQVALDSIDKPTPSAKKHLPGAGTVAADGSTSAYFTRVRPRLLDGSRSVVVVVVADDRPCDGRPRSVDAIRRARAPVPIALLLARLAS